MNATTLSLVFLTCVLLSMTEGAIIFNPKCRCTTTHSKPIRPERIQKFVTIAPGPHCKDLQVIATIQVKKTMEICVNPNEPWVQEALKRKELAN
ncbi:hypothetical protein NFI96_016728 [Prochilodus magdalenae]|nr:hypothetical protein NFI96_016728 [Prochilodus magdalenae]